MKTLRSSYRDRPQTLRRNLTMVPPALIRQMAKKLHLVPKSDKAKRRGWKVRNVIVELENEDKVFVRFEGWNYWTWVKKKDDPHYTVKRGWIKVGEAPSFQRSKL